MEVQIISTETIKPFSPTPNHLRTFKFSLLDQLSPPLYVTGVYFYKNNPTSTFNNATQKSVHLKKSLSKTLIHFYPLAGRVSEDGSSIDCNDQGVEYIETYVTSVMSEVIEQPDTFMLRKLVKRDPECIRTDLLSSEEIMSVQVNHFGCGGKAIGVTILHEIGDASSLANFVNAWAEIARGSSSSPFNNHNNNVGDIMNGKSFVFKCTHILPPIDEIAGAKPVYDIFKNNQGITPKTLTKRFVFDKFKIDALRDKLVEDDNDSEDRYRPPRVEAVTALIWGVVISSSNKIRKGSSEQTEMEMEKKKHLMFHMLNLRSRMNPPFPPHCLGSLILGSELAEWPMEEEEKIDYKVLAQKTHKSIRAMTGEHLRTTLNDIVNRYLLVMTDKMMSTDRELIVFTSWCRFQFYDADFGWGRPVWFGPCGLPNHNMNYVVFVDTIDGRGIEAWVRTTDDNMTKLLEHNSVLLAYASLNPNPLLFCCNCKSNLIR